MEQLTLAIPKMWGDHHVLAVRETLAALDGVGEVEASAAQKLVRLSFDPAVGRERIVQALRDAGYDPSDTVEFAEPPASTASESPRFAEGVRVTQTNRLDLEMSGDFRKY